MQSSETSRTTDSVRERKKFAAKLANCLVQVLLFWKICSKKDKTKHAELETHNNNETGKNP